jgi:formamidopyrimidine-DNA glycosylase
VPELPEVETVRRGVEAAFSGRRIDSVEASGVRTTRRYPDRQAFADRCRGQVLVAVDRVGKYLLLRLGGGDVVVVHLGMSGQLLRAAVDDPRPAHTHVVWSFEGGRQLRFVDPRTFGEVFVTRPEATGVIPELAPLGPDALAGLQSWRSLATVLADRTTRLKPLLLDQHRVAGIGNIYADEILFDARLAGDRPARSLTTVEVQRLHASIGAILSTAVAHRGSSLSDAQYRDVEGTVGDYQLHHAVYAREGRPCRVCGTPIVRRREAGRSSFSCPRCQR